MTVVKIAKIVLATLEMLLSVVGILLRVLVMAPMFIPFGLFGRLGHFVTTFVVFVVAGALAAWCLSASLTPYIVYFTVVYIACVLISFMATIFTFRDKNNATDEVPFIGGIIFGAASMAYMASAFFIGTLLMRLF